MRLINRIRQAENQAFHAAAAAERARQWDPCCTLAAVQAEKAAEDAEWYRALAERIEGDDDKHPRHKISVLRGLMIVAEQSRDLAQKAALTAIEKRRA
jgi:hypothetical protein